MSDVERTWAGNRTYGAARVVRPRSLDDLPDLVRGSDRLRVLGTRHSFNGVADTTGTHVLLDHLEGTVEVDVAARTATVPAWATYGEVAPVLHAHGLALQALASLPHVSVAGACATATHGSGVATRTLSAAVRAMTFVDGTGQHVVTSRDDDGFDGLVVHLGAIGIVTSLSLDLVEAVPWHQRAYVDLPAAVLATHLDEVMGVAESVSCFTRWQDETVHMVLAKGAVGTELPGELLGAPLATSTLHPVPGRDAENRTESTGVPGRWYDRLPHFRLDHIPSSGTELQSEWFVDRRDAVPALAALWAVGDRLDAALQVSEVRTVAADGLWLSPASRRDVLALHCTWVDEPALVADAIDVVEDALAPFDPMPHWGKLTHLDVGRAARRHGRVDEFAALVAAHDPEGRFRNELVDRLLDDAARGRT